MSCPLMAGAVALVREWLMRDRGFKDAEPPTSALMKAIVTGGAKDAPVPNNNQGWGRFDLQSTLFPSDRAVHLIDRIPFESDTDFGWIVETTNAAPLDVQLAWVDYPGTPGNEAAPKLINDLDLTVERMDGADASILYGNGGTEPDVLNNLESVRIASAEPNRYLITVSCKNVLYDYKDGGAAALYIRGAFDPAAVKDGPSTVRIRETEAYYRSIDAALAAVRPGETVEILGAAKLRNTFFVTNSCTITATNANPWASAAVFMRGAQLVITNGAEVTFTNVAFGSNGGAQVKVHDGSLARLAGAFGLDRIQTDNWTCLELATAITNVVEVDCLDAPSLLSPSNRVAWSDLPLSDMSASANHLLFPFDDERGGVATDGSEVGKATLVVWQDDAPVPDAAAAVKLNQGEGDVNYRTFAALLRHYDFTENAAIKVCKDCPLGARIRLTGERFLSVVGVPSAVGSVAPSAGFDIVGDSSMVVSNVTFRGTVDNSLFAVGDRTGSAGELVFGGGAVADGVFGRSEIGGGAVCVYGGRLLMEEGSRMSGCHAERNKACGGAVYLGPGTTFDLMGGVITDCYAAVAGGGVFAYASSTVNLSGASAVVGNTSTEKHVMDDICCENNESSSVALNLTGRLTGENGPVGIGFGPYGSLAGEGDAFANIDAELLADDAEASAPVFLNDAAPGDLTAAVSGSKLVWVVNPLGRGGCEPELANVRVVYPDDVTNYYEHVAGALANLTGACELELLRNDTFEGELSVGFDVTLRTAPETNASETNKLERVASGRILVKPDVTLKLENVRISGTGEGDAYGTGNLIAVNGGRLELKSGADVGHVFGGTNRADGVITVYNGGQVLTEEGSLVSDGRNPYFDKVKDVDSGVGGGILVDGDSVAKFKGGRVTDCQASRGGGVAIANKSTAYVSGDFTATGNRDLHGAANDFTTEDLSSLVLADDFTGSVGIAEGIECDTNVFGRVDDRYYGQASFTSLTNGAANFFHDVRRVRGVVATNGTDTALLVWSDAFVDADGTPKFVFVDEKGVSHTYWAMGELPTPLPPPEPPEPTPQWKVDTYHPGPIAFKSIERVSDTEWTLVVTNRVRYCNYRLIWATDLKQGFVSTGDWEHVVHEDCATWTTNVITTGGAWFWRAEGADGTNMILKVVE